MPPARVTTFVGVEAVAASKSTRRMVLPSETKSAGVDRAASKASPQGLMKPADKGGSSFQEPAVAKLEVPLNVSSTYWNPTSCPMVYAHDAIVLSELTWHEKMPKRLLSTTRILPVPSSATPRRFCSE